MFADFSQNWKYPEYIALYISSVSPRAGNVVIFSLQFSHFADMMLGFNGGWKEEIDMSPHHVLNNPLEQIVDS